jgi:virginiamycin B lyase
MRLPGPVGRWPIPLAAAVALTLLSACSALGGTGLTSTGGGSTAGGGTAGGGTTGTVKVQTFPVPTASSDLANIATGPDGSLWFTEKGANKVGRITTAGQITEYPIPNNASGLSDTGPTNIVESGGAMWFLTDIGQSVYRITSGGTYTQVYNQQTYNASNLAPSSSGGVWLMMTNGDGFAQDGDALALVDPDGKATGYPATHPNHMYAIALAPNGRVWYNNQGSSLNSMAQSGQELSSPLSSQTTDEVSSIAFTRDGTPWFTEYVPGDVTGSGCCGAVGDFSGGTAHVTPIGVQHVVAGLEPHSLVVGPDGDLWFAFNRAYTGGYDGIGRIDPATGHVELATTDPYIPTDIAFGSDRALWFVDQSHNVIGRIPVNGQPF